jgi:hypothetical protein
MYFVSAEKGTMGAWHRQKLVMREGMTFLREESESGKAPRGVPRDSKALNLIQISLRRHKTEVKPAGK